MWPDVGIKSSLNFPNVSQRVADKGVVKCNFSKYLLKVPSLKHGLHNLNFSDQGPIPLRNL